MGDDIAVNPFIYSKKRKNFGNYLTYFNLCFVLKRIHLRYRFYFHILRMKGTFQLSYQRRASFAVSTGFPISFCPKDMWQDSLRLSRDRKNRSKNLRKRCGDEGVFVNRRGTSQASFQGIFPSNQPFSSQYATSDSINRYFFCTNLIR